MLKTLKLKYPKTLLFKTLGEIPFLPIAFLACGCITPTFPRLSHGLPLFSVHVLYSFVSCKDTCHWWDSEPTQLFQYMSFWDSKLNYICKDSFFQIRSHAHVSGLHIFWGANIQAAIAGKNLSVNFIWNSMV